ncbi:MAG: hypothetical protein HZC01_01310 [Candidatus Kerfeldbacteria bacterium]|nr:hypothetical protein [Candidatus Kerfeldbacteria bacterium]
MVRWLKSHRIVFRIAIVTAMVIVPLTTFAQGANQTDPCAITDFTKAIKLSIEIPGVTVNHDGGHYIKNLGCYIVGIYRYFAGVAGILTTVFVMYGGFRYVISFGNQSQIQSAKETISSALIGLLLVVSSYTILYFINPNLTRFDVIDFTPIAEFGAGWCEDREGTATPKVEGSVNCGDVGTVERTGVIESADSKQCVYKGSNCTDGETCQVIADDGREKTYGCVLSYGDRKVCKEKLFQTCGFIWHEGQTDECIGITCGENKVCAAVEEDGKSTFECIDQWPILNPTDNLIYNAHILNDLDCGMIKEKTVPHNLLIGKVCEEGKSCVIMPQARFNFFGPGDIRPPDQSIVGGFVQYFCQ